MPNSRTIALVSLALVAACDGSVTIEPPPCTLEARPGVAVTIVDSVSGAFLAEQSIAVAVDGAFADTLQLSLGELQGGVLRWKGRAGAYERVGTYVVSVIVPGYRLWQQRDVVVTRDACHVRTQQLTARLLRG